MKKGYIFLGAFLCCILAKVNAWEKDMISGTRINHQEIQVDSNKQKKPHKGLYSSRTLYIDKKRNKLMRDGDTIQKGDVVIINTEWNAKDFGKRSVEKILINIDTVNIYTPTTNEIASSKYKIEVKPDTTTTYSVVAIRKDGTMFSLPKRIVVVDANGKELK